MRVSKIRKHFMIMKELCTGLLGIYFNFIVFSCKCCLLLLLFIDVLFAGPIAEFELPVDTMTKKVKGFAHITFMIPEHAVKAFSELDGTSFMVSSREILQLGCVLRWE